MDWKEKINDIVFDDLKDLCGNTNCQVVVDAINKIVETQIISKIIDEAIDGRLMYSHQEQDLKQQLKKNWLSGEKEGEV